MSKFEKIISGLVGLALVLSLIAIFNSPTGVKLGGTVENYPSWFVNGIFGGTTKSFSVSTTGQIQTGAALDAGCLVIGDSANGASPVYITASGATVTASTTVPAACTKAK